MEKFRVSWTPDLRFCSGLLGCPLSYHVFQFLLSNNHALLNMFIRILSKMDTSANIPYISHSSPAAAPQSSMAHLLYSAITHAHSQSRDQEEPAKDRIAVRTNTYDHKV